MSEMNERYGIDNISKILTFSIKLRTKEVMILRNDISILTSASLPVRLGAV